MASREPDKTATTARPHAVCPICARPQAHETRPFCSKRCADIDLHRWLSGSYAFAAEATASDEGESASTPEGRDD